MPAQEETAAAPPTIDRALVVPVTIDRILADVRRTIRRGEPVTFGVPLPKGAAHPDQTWQLLDGSRATPVQAQPLDRWTDGSVRWLLVDARVDVPALRSATLQLVPAVTAYDGPAIGVRTSESTTTVDTGAATFEIRQQGGFPFDDVIVDGRSARERASSGFAIVDRDRRRYVATVRQANVTTRGRLRVTVDVDGTLTPAAGLPLDVHARIDFFLGLSTVRIALRIRNPQRARHGGGFWDLGDQGSVYIRDASLTLARQTPGDTRVMCSPELGLPVEQFESPFELYQDSSGGANWRSTAHINRERRVPVSFRGYRIRSNGDERYGLRATPLVTVRDDRGTTSVAVPYFWQNFPKAIEASAARMTLRFFPYQFADVHELQGGEQKTHTFYLGFGGDPVSEPGLEWCRTPVVAHADPQWCMASGAIPWLSAGHPDHQSLVNSAIQGSDTFERKREIVDEYGWRNFGDIYGDHEAVRQKGPMPLVSHYNNQYDPVAGFLLQFLRTGDSRWWTMGRELAAHVVDIDVYHTSADKWAYNHGLFWHTYHYGDADTATHRSYPRAARGITHGGGPSGDHNYTTGLLLHYFLSGDSMSRDTVLSLAQYVIDLDDGGKTPLRFLSREHTGFATASGSYAYHGPGRGPANSLNALLDGHRLTAEGKFLAKAEQIIQRAVHPDDDIAEHRLDLPEDRWFYTMFLQSLGKYLAAKAERAQLDARYAYARAALLHYARWMAAHEYPYLDKPEKLQFPTETWAAQDIRKSDVFSFAVMHASGAERERFLERSEFFFRRSVDTLRAISTRTLARPVVVLLTSGLVHDWMTNANLTLPEPASHGPFPKRVPFIRQKRRALRRAVALLGAAALATAIGLAVYWFA